MKKTKVIFLSMPLALILAGCVGGKINAVLAEPEQPQNRITLKDPTDTSMLTSNCKAYIDAMRNQEKSLGNKKYAISDLGGENGVKVEDYLDQGTVEGRNETVSGQIPNRSDRNEGVTLSFEVDAEFDTGYRVLVSKNLDFSNAKTYQGDDIVNHSVNVKNLFVNTTYYWKVVAGENESDVGTFTTGDYPRWISARPLYNVRDNGGYMTDSGRRVKQGLVYRGGEITSSTQPGHYNTIATSSSDAFRNVMKIGVELDLRGPSDISDGYNANAFSSNIVYQQYAIKSYEQTFTQTRNMVAPIFEILKDADQNPVYYHCFGGADRTGTLGFLLNGVLGVSYTDLVIDFELTSYSSINNEHIRSHIDGHQHQYDRWPALINHIQTDTTGGYEYDPDIPLKDNLKEFLVKACSVPEETIEQIREIMLEPAKADNSPKKGCGGSITASASLLALAAISGFGVVAIKRKKEDK